MRHTISETFGILAVSGEYAWTHPQCPKLTDLLTYYNNKNNKQQQLLLLLLSYMYREAKPGFFARLTRRKPRTEAADEDAMRTQETPGYCI